MLKYRKKNQVNPQSLLGNKSKWRASEPGCVGFENCLTLERRGRKEAEVAQINISAEKHKEHLITISAVDIVGKIQLAIQGKVILTISEPGTFFVKFTAATEQVNISIRCVARTDARGKIATFKVQPVEAILDS